MHFRGSTSVSKVILPSLLEMPKKKLRKKVLHQDFTLNDAANAEKPVLRIKKAPAIEPVSLESWDEIADNDLDIVEEIGADGSKKLVYKKRKSHAKSVQGNSDFQTGNVYPEILWYFISHYIKPEDVGKFALLNKTCYAISKQERFWKMLYNKYCMLNHKLPERLRLEKSYKSYGIKQRTIRALYHTYDVFIKRVAKEAAQDSKPHNLVKRRCVGNWYSKGLMHWIVFFKFKKIYPLQTVEKKVVDILEELSRVDANPDEDCQVLQIHCLDFQDVPPLMGMMLSSVRVLLSKNFEFHRVHLGFNSGFHSISKNILPECSVVLNSAIKIFVFDWWHPMYPHFDNKSPMCGTDDLPVTLLQKNFFHTCDGKDCCPS